jgi:hypothetical protein
MFSASNNFLLLAYARTGTNLQENADNDNDNGDDGIRSVDNPSSIVTYCEDHNYV